MLSIFFILMISCVYFYLAYFLENEISLEILRLHRIEHFSIRKFKLNRKIDKLRNKVYKTEKQKSRVFKRVEKMKKKVGQIEINLLYLENYGEKT